MKTLGIIFIFLTFLMSMQACTHYTSHDPLPTRQADTVANVGEYVVIEFPPGRDRLLDSEKAKIRDLQAAVESRVNVDAIRVMAWSDQEYPVGGSVKPSMAEQKLADDRGRAIREFIKQELRSKKDIDTHNMAKQPGVFAQVFNSSDYQIKNRLEEIDKASNELGIVSENKGSKALIVVTYQ